jgi:hypothetical protein
MNNTDLHNLAKLDLIEAIKNFRNTWHHLGYTDAEVKYELYDAILDATDGAINIDTGGEYQYKP